MAIFPDDSEGKMTTLTTLAEAVLTQRRERMTDAGPSLRGVGNAHFQLSGGMLLVNHAQPRPGRADEMIERVNRFARERWLAVQWTFTHGRDDPAMQAALTGHQYYIRETLRLMGRVGELVPAPISPDVTVGRVATLQEMQAYERISSWGFNHQQHPTLDHVLVRGRERWDEQQAHWYQYYLGRLLGEPVSGAYISLWERVPTIYGVATIPPARQHGVAGHVLRLLVRETLAMGFAWTCLYVTVGNHAQHLYESLGYSALLDQTTYQLGESRW